MKAVEWAFSRLAKFMNESPFGEITFTIQDGKVVNVKTIISEKPPLDSRDQKA